MSDFPWQNVAKRLPRHREMSSTECMCYVRPQITTTPSSEDPDPGDTTFDGDKECGIADPNGSCLFFFFHSGADSKRYFYTTGVLSVQKHMLECQKCRNLVAVFKVKSKINLITLIFNQLKVADGKTFQKEILHLDKRDWFKAKEERKWAHDHRFIGIATYSIARKCILLECWNRLLRV